MSHLRHILAATGLIAAVPVIAADTPADTPMELEEIVVTGSRVRRVNVDSSSPLTSLNADRFQISAETNIVRQPQELPSFYPGRSPVSGSESGFTGSFADLRGLGSTRTLVLVNGRRWINTVSTSAVDLATIPPELIERVDVVTGGASATYGSDAVAGVVNIILKDDFDGVEFNAQTGMTDRGEATNTRYSLTAGQEFGEGRGSAYVHVSHDITEGISGARRSFLNPLVENIDGELVPLNRSHRRLGRQQHLPGHVRRCRSALLPWHAYQVPMSIRKGS